jgi:putative transposase
MADNLQRPMFGAFDPKAEIAKTERNLPHWFQPEVATFITFRTADSMPAKVVQRWREELCTWLISHGCDPTIAEKNGREQQLPRDLQRAYMKMRNRGWLDRLDECHGDCVLRRPELAKIVGDSLLHLNGERYDVDSFVVMPNHVHTLVQFRAGTTLAVQTKSWLRFTAGKINTYLDLHGKFWQSEPFDHLVRSASQFEYLQRYIAENPNKAKLGEGEYLYWSL